MIILLTLFLVQVEFEGKRGRSRRRRKAERQNSRAAEQQNGGVTLQMAHNGYRVVLNNTLGCKLRYHKILGFDCAPRTGIIPIKANTWSELMYNPTAEACGYSNILSKEGF